MRLQLTLNGRRAGLEVEPNELLLDVLRERLGRPGARPALVAGTPKPL